MGYNAVMRSFFRCFLFQPRPSSTLSRAGTVGFWLWNWGMVTAAALGLGLVCLALAPGQYGWEVFQDYFSSPGLVALNLLPPVLLAWLLYGLLVRPWLAQLLTVLPMLALAMGNYYKLAFRDDPVIASDLALLGEASQMAGRYDLSLNTSLWCAVLLSSGSVVFLSLLVRGRPRWKGRLAGALVPLAVGAALIPAYTSDRLYNDTAQLQHLQQWSATQQYLSHGLLYPFLHSIKDALPNPPEGYSSGSAQALMAQYQDGEIPQEEQVNIVGIMLEAFADFSIYDQIQLGQDVYAGLHQLQQESYHGNLLTNIFAGGTINTERAFLTGLSSGQFNFRSNTSSYVWHLKSQGYQTSGAHPSNQWFYNRSNVNAYLGFDQYHFLENWYAQRTGGGIAYDDVFFPELTQWVLEQMEADQPLFSFSVSYQGHGPYDDQTCFYGDAEDFVGNPELSDAARNILANYLGSLQDTCAHLLALADSLRQVDEPVILVIFGDHKPWLGNGDYVYEELGIDLSLDDVDGFYNHWATPYLIWANPAAKEVLGNEFTGRGPDISPCFLMNVLFDQCGWEGDAYMQAVYDCWQALPVIHTSGLSLTADGILTGQLSPEDQALAQQFSWLEYYRSTHFAY